MPSVPDVPHRSARWPIGAAFVASGLLMMTGVALYLLTRPSSVLFIRAADALGLWPMLVRLRAGIGPGVAETWVASSLPFGLFVVASLLSMRAIWAGADSSDRWWWFWAAPVLALASEFAQAVGVVPGRFDWMDVATLSATFVVGVLVLRFPFIPFGERQS